VQTDLYAVGATLYHLLTRKYPYGEIEPFQRPKFGEPVPPARTRPDLSPWLENVILKAVARVPAQRFETAEEMLLALERGEANPLLRRRTPLIEQLAGRRLAARRGCLDHAESAVGVFAAGKLKARLHLRLLSSLNGRQDGSERVCYSASSDKTRACAGNRDV
jgi:serine/threonine protein kinase